VRRKIIVTLMAKTVPIVKMYLVQATLNASKENAKRLTIVLTSLVKPHKSVLNIRTNSNA